MAFSRGSVRVDLQTLAGIARRSVHLFRQNSPACSWALLFRTFSKAATMADSGDSFSAGIRKLAKKCNSFFHEGLEFDPFECFAYKLDLDLTKSST